jgi:hypothetical protein
VSTEADTSLSGQQAAPLLNARWQTVSRPRTRETRGLAESPLPSTSLSHPSRFPPRPSDRLRDGGRARRGAHRPSSHPPITRPRGRTPRQGAPPPSTPGAKPGTSFAFPSGAENARSRRPASPACYAAPRGLHNKLCKIAGPALSKLGTHFPAPTQRISPSPGAVVREGAHRHAPHALAAQRCASRRTYPPTLPSRGSRVRVGARRPLPPPFPRGRASAPAQERRNEGCPPSAIVAKRNADQGRRQKSPATDERLAVNISSHPPITPPSTHVDLTPPLFDVGGGPVATADGATLGPREEISPTHPADVDWKAESGAGGGQTAGGRSAPPSGHRDTNTHAPRRRRGQGGGPGGRP